VCVDPGTAALSIPTLARRKKKTKKPEKPQTPPTPNQLREWLPHVAYRLKAESPKRRKKRKRRAEITPAEGGVNG
jgi:hypothetical protein